MAGPTLPPGFVYRPDFLDRAEQATILRDVTAVIAAAPLFRPAMPRTGKPMSVMMTNAGPLGWVTDKAHGYRYQPTHPETGNAWPPIPPSVLAIWNAVASYPLVPEACLVNYYAAEARMGLHQDSDEQDLAAPVVSISLGDDCRFRIGGTARTDPTASLRLRSGDVLVLGGESRSAFHGVDRIYPGTSTLLAPHLPAGSRINLTLRRVSPR